MQFTVRGVAVTVTPVILITLVLGLGIAGYGRYDYVQQSDAVDDAVAVETTVVDTDISRSDGLIGVGGEVLRSITNAGSKASEQLKSLDHDAWLTPKPATVFAAQPPI